MKLIHSAGGKYYFIIPLYLLFAYLSLSTLYPKFDEYYAHLPTLKSIYNGNVIDEILSDDYKAANTPLPYLLIALPAKLIHSAPDLLTTRIINIFISFITIFLLLYLYRKKNKSPSGLHPAGTGNILYFILIIFFYPYFLKPSFTYYLAVYGLLFFILTIIFLTKDGYINLALAGIFNSLAILSQQFYLIVPVWYLFYSIVNTKQSVDIKSGVTKLLIFSFPLIIPLLLFISWEGLVPGNFAQYKVTTALISLSNLTVMTVVFGGLFLFFVLDNYKKIKISWLSVYLFSAILLNAFFNPQWDIISGPGKISGYTYHALEYLNVWGFLPGLFIKIVLSAIGISTLHLLFLSLTDRNDKLYYVLIILFIIGFTFSTPLSERHILPLVILLYLLLFPKIKNKLIIKIWLVTQILIGSVYFYYWIFLQKV